MEVTAIGRPRGQSDRADLVARVRTAVGPVKAVMLYGSEARGSASARSDIDILALVSENPRSTFNDELAITAYRPAHLRALAERGSLFVLHLTHDGVLLHDPYGMLADILAAYRPPAEPDRLTAEFAVVAGGLVSATPAERASSGPAMQSLAFYVLRTAVYDACARRAEPQFDCVRALEKLGLSRLAPLLDERRESFTASRLDRVLRALPSVLPGCERLGRAGLAATAVAVASDCPLASDLLAGVLAGQSVGHPLGATGAILVFKALYELWRTAGQYALVTMCIGGGQGIAAIFERM